MGSMTAALLLGIGVRTYVPHLSEKEKLHFISDFLKVPQIIARPEVTYVLLFKILDETEYAQGITIKIAGKRSDRELWRTSFRTKHKPL